MQTILILGGTRDALRIARYCIALCRSFNRYEMLSVIYSVAGLGRMPSLECEINVGGFGGRQGLQQYLVRHRASLLIDATHPFAINVKANAEFACNSAKIPLIRYMRPAWQQSNIDCWQQFATKEKLLLTLSTFQRPFFTLGQSVLDLLCYKTQPPFIDQFWTIRTINNIEVHLEKFGSKFYLLKSIGPFSFDDELQLLKNHKIDVLICKNSGGHAVSAKIKAAAHLGLPVLMLKRPELADIPKQFEQISAIEVELKKFIKHFHENSDLNV